MSSAGGFAAALDSPIPADELRSQLNGAVARIPDGPVEQSHPDGMVHPIA
jgi:hypothetical protein